MGIISSVGVKVDFGSLVELSGVVVDCTPGAQLEMKSVVIRIGLKKLSFLAIEPELYLMEPLLRSYCGMGMSW